MNTPSPVAERFGHLADRFEALVAATPPDRWASPSPCAEWDARDVVRHVVDVHGMMLRPLQRTLSPAPSVDDDPLAAVRAARADLQAVVDDPAVAATEYDGYFGPTTVQATVDQFMCSDLVIHAWDLARATGQRYDIEPAEIERLREDYADLGDNMRSPQVCADPVPVGADASAQDRLIAFTGRDPNWRP